MYTGRWRLPTAFKAYVQQHLSKGKCLNGSIVAMSLNVTMILFPNKRRWIATGTSQSLASSSGIHKLD